MKLLKNYNSFKIVKTNEYEVDTVSKKPLVRYILTEVGTKTKCWIVYPSIINYNKKYFKNNDIIMQFNSRFDITYNIKAVQQFSGNYDSLGKPIYIGDVINKFDAFSNNDSVVKYTNGTYSLEYYIFSGYDAVFERRYKKTVKALHHFLSSELTINGLKFISNLSSPNIESLYVINTKDNSRYKVDEIDFKNENVKCQNKEFPFLDLIFQPDTGFRDVSGNVLHIGDVIQINEKKYFIDYNGEYILKKYKKKEI